MLTQVTILPIGTGEETKDLLADAAKIVAQSGLDYQLTSMSTIIEGEWDEVMVIIKKCHQQILGFSERVVTNIAIDERRGLQGRLKGNVLDIEYAVGDRLETGRLT